MAVEASQAAQEALFALGIVVYGGGIWSFLGFLKVADKHQRLINHEATSFAFVGSLLLTLAIGILRRFGFLSGASHLVPAFMIALWSIGLILFSWRGFLFSADTFSTIDFPGGTATVAGDVNDRRQIIGNYGDASGNTRGLPELLKHLILFPIGNRVCMLSTTDFI